MSRSEFGSDSYGSVMNLQDFCARSEVKKPTSFRVQDLLPVPYSQVSPANNNSITSSSFTSSSPTSLPSPNPPTSPQLSESDSSRETGSPDSRDHSPPIPKKNRSFFTSGQIFELERVFEKQQYLGTRERQQLALALRMTDQQVKTWFQNRRMKRKRKRTEETQYYTKLALANRMVSGPLSPQPVFPSYQPPMYSYTSYPPVMPSSYQTPSPEHQGFLCSPPAPMYPGIELCHPSGPSSPPEYPGLRLTQPSLCRDCPEPECSRACAPHFSYPPNMFNCPDYSALR